MLNNFLVQKSNVKKFLIISAIFSIIGVISAVSFPFSVNSATTQEVEDCLNGERTPEEMGWEGFTCAEMESGAMENSLLNWVRMSCCILCIPATMILGIIYPLMKTPDPDGKIALKLKQLDDVNVQLEQAKANLQNSLQSLSNRQSLVSQNEQRIQMLEQSSNSIVESQLELEQLHLELAQNKMAAEKAKQEYEDAQNALQTLRDVGIAGTVQHNVYNVQDSVVMGDIGLNEKKEIRDSSNSNQQNSKPSLLEIGRPDGNGYEWYTSEDGKNWYRTQGSSTDWFEFVP